MGMSVFMCVSEIERDKMTERQGSQRNRKTEKQKQRKRKRERWKGRKRSRFNIYFRGS